jgi:hypothetical protein
LHDVQVFETTGGARETYKIERQFIAFNYDKNGVLLSIEYLD